MAATQDLQRLVVSLEARIDKFEKTMAKAQATTNRTAGGIEKRFAAMDRSLSTVGAHFASSIKNFAAGFIGAAGFNQLSRAVITAVKNLADLGDKAADLGMKAADLQTFNRMMLESGGATEDMATALAKLAEEGQDADSKMSKLFAKFNRSVTGNAKQDMLTFMGILEQMTTQSEKLAALADVFGGKLGGKMAETLTQGADKFFETNDAMRKAGELRTDEEIKHARDIESAYNVLWDKLATSWEESVIKRIEGTQREIEAIKAAWGSFGNWWDTYVDELTRTWNSGQPNALQQMFGAPTGATPIITGKRGGSGASSLRGKSATPEQRNAIEAVAGELGISPVDLATAIAYETGGTMSPSEAGKGPAAGRFGLIQFGPKEAADYGAGPGQNFTEQMQAVKRYLKARGLQPGSSLLDIYSTINAGSPGRYGASDVPGKTVASHVAAMGPYQSAARQWMAPGQYLNPANGYPTLPPGHVGTPGYEQGQLATALRKPLGKAPVTPRDKPITPDESLYYQTETNLTTLNRLYEEQQAQLEKTTAASNAYAEQLSGTVGSAVSGLVDDLMNGVEAGEALSNMFKRLASQLVDMAIQQLFSAGGAPGGLFGQLFGGATAAIPARAEGGPVSPGSAYVVGEKGAELFMPRTPGVIVPHGRSGGGDVNLAVSVTRTKEFEVEVRRIAGGLVPGTLRAARKGYPTTASRFQKLGTV